MWVHNSRPSHQSPLPRNIFFHFSTAKRIGLPLRMRYGDIIREERVAARRILPPFLPHVHGWRRVDALLLLIFDESLKNLDKTFTDPTNSRRRAPTKACCLFIRQRSSNFCRGMPCSTGPVVVGSLHSEHTLPTAAAGLCLERNGQEVGKLAEKPRRCKTAFSPKKRRQKKQKNSKQPGKQGCAKGIFSVSFVRVHISFQVAPPLLWCYGSDCVFRCKGTCVRGLPPTKAANLTLRALRAETESKAKTNSGSVHASPATQGDVPLCESCGGGTYVMLTQGCVGRAKQRTPTFRSCTS